MTTYSRGFVAILAVGLSSFIAACAPRSSSEPVTEGVTGPAAFRFNTSFSTLSFVPQRYSEVGVQEVSGVRKIIVGGATQLQGGGGSEVGLLLARYNVDGTLDPTFGNDGTLVDFSGQATGVDAMKVLPDGKILVAGYNDDHAGLNWNTVRVIRHNANGSIDPTFGIRGVATLSLGTSNTGAIKLLSDTQGRLIVVGAAALPLGGAGIALARLDSSGVLDTTFGTAGKALVGYQNDAVFVSDAVVDPVTSAIYVIGQSFVVSKPVLMKFNSSGALDTTFHADGMVEVDGFADADAIGMLPGHAVVVAGRNPDMTSVRVAKYSATGVQDAAFGTGGYGDIPLNAMIRGVEVSAGGAIFIGGAIDSDLAVLKFKPDGTPDTAFGAGDAYAKGPETACDTMGSEEGCDYGYGLALLSDGRLVVAGQTTTAAVTDTYHPTPMIAMFTAAGALDAAFSGGTGYHTLISTQQMGSEEAGHFPPRIVRQRSGKIVSVAVLRNAQNFTQVAVSRYSVDGTLDTSFGTGGRTLISNAIFDLDPAKVPLNHLAYDVALDAQDRIVIAGYEFLMSDELTVTRLTADGALDATFNGIGHVKLVGGAELPGSSAGRALAIQGDGKIVVAGVGTDDNMDPNLAVARLNADGSLDTSFAGTGATVLAIGAPGSTMTANALALQPDGKIVIAGTHDNGAGTTQVAVVRLKADGTFDPDFGTGGKVLGELGDSQYSTGAALALQDGKIVVGGYVKNAGEENHFALARVTAAGALDPTFGTAGKVLTSLDALGTIRDRPLGVQRLRIDSQGRIVAAGTSVVGASGVAAVTVVRYGANGAIDTGFGTQGIYRTDFGLSGPSAATDLQLEDDGSYLLTGSTLPTGGVGLHNLGLLRHRF